MYLNLGPSPKVPFNKRRFVWDFRWFFDYSGGQMTDWAGMEWNTVRPSNSSATQGLR